MGYKSYLKLQLPPNTIPPSLAHPLASSLPMAASRHSLQSPPDRSLVHWASPCSLRVPATASAAPAANSSGERYAVLVSLFIMPATSLSNSSDLAAPWTPPGTTALWSASTSPKKCPSE
uniref:Uncharacterized protein n=1 Tax=Triticum urartu TaxID=4572 RepID=A0A8R7QLK6_TRIUA